MKKTKRGPPKRPPSVKDCSPSAVGTQSNDRAPRPVESCVFREGRKRITRVGPSPPWLARTPGVGLEPTTSFFAKDALCPLSYPGIGLRRNRTSTRLSTGCAKHIHAGDLSDDRRDRPLVVEPRARRTPNLVVGYSKA